MRAVTSPITLTKLIRVACWAVIILVVFAFDGHAQQLKDLVKLAGANDLNDAIIMTISSGTATVLFTVTVTGQQVRAMSMDSSALLAYDATFGSYKLFLWAAGAGTGSNIFKQMGTTATAGGNADVTLTAPGGGR
jgi:hypothetical protein